MAKHMLELCQIMRLTTSRLSPAHNKLMSQTHWGFSGLAVYASIMQDLRNAARVRTRLPCNALDEFSVSGGCSRFARRW